MGKGDEEGGDTAVGVNCHPEFILYVVKTIRTEMFLSWVIASSPSAATLKIKSGFGKIYFVEFSDGRFIFD